MAKKVANTIRLQIKGGAANPAPPVGPALGQAGVNIMEFCKAFNAKTQEQAGSKVTVVITVYADRSFSFETKTPLTSELVKKYAKVKKGSGEPNKNKVGTIKMDKIREIAEIKMQDLSAANIENAMKMVMGSCKSMGITVTK